MWAGLSKWLSQCFGGQPKSAPLEPLVLSSFGEKISAWILRELEKSQGVSLRDDPLAVARIRQSAQAAEVTLARGREASVNLPFLGVSKRGPVHFQAKFSRAEVENLS